MTAAPPVYYPLFLRVEGRDVLVVGAGEVASRKVDDLVDAGARVRVVAPAAAASVRDRAASGEVAWSERAFEERDVDGAWLVVSATGDPAVERRVFARCEEARTFVVAVDDPANGSAISGSVVRRAPFVVAISSSGEAPALTRLLREVIESALPDERWVDAARALRARWRREKTPMGSRFGELVRAFSEIASRGDR